MNERILDVYYVAGNGEVGPSIANIIRGWDGLVYIETNVKPLAGEGRLIQWSDDGIIRIEGEMINGGLGIEDKYKLSFHSIS
jgi:hypothetical protein